MEITAKHNGSGIEGYHDIEAVIEMANWMKIDVYGILMVKAGLCEIGI